MLPWRRYCLRMEFVEGNSGTNQCERHAHADRVLSGCFRRMHEASWKLLRIIHQHSQMPCLTALITWAFSWTATMSLKHHTSQFTRLQPGRSLHKRRSSLPRCRLRWSPARCVALSAGPPRHRIEASCFERRWGGEWAAKLEAPQVSSINGYSPLKRLTTWARSSNYGYQPRTKYPASVCRRCFVYSPSSFALCPCHIIWLVFGMRSMFNV